jgi:DNA polymerase elongation subunit (family B)
MKEVYYAVLESLLAQRGAPVMEAIETLNRAMRELVDGQVPVDKLMITRSLKSDYKVPMQIAHHVLSLRMAERDPGSKPKSGDRIRYLYFVPPASQGKRLLQGQRIETPEFIAQHRLPVDYGHYLTNQLMNPLMQLLSLCVETYWEHHQKRKPLAEFRRELDRFQKQCGDDLEAYNKMREKYASKRVKELVFDPFLNDLAQRHSGMRRIDHLFARAAAAGR